MSNFLRAARLCLGRRWTIATALTCSVLVGTFWGTNIGAVLPLVRVLMRGQSVLESLDSDIAACRLRIDELDQEIAQRSASNLDSSTGASETDSAKLQRLVDRRQAESFALTARQRLRPWAERLLPTDPYRTLLVVVGLLAFATLMRSGFQMANALLVERAVRKATLQLREQFFSRVLEMDLSQLGETSTGEMTSQFTYDMNTLVMALRNLFGRATVEPLKMLACLIGAGLICWRLLLMSLIFAPVAGFLIRKLATSIKRYNRKAMEEMSRLVAGLSESLESVRVIKAFTMEHHESTRLAKRAKAFYRKSLRVALFDSLTKPSMELFGIGVTCAALLIGGYLVLEQQTHVLRIKLADRPLSPEMMIAFFAMLVGMSDPARKFAAIFNKLQPGVPAADRIFRVIDRSPTITEPPSPMVVTRPHEALTFQNIRFAYGDGTEVLRGISLTVPHGQKLAIVGANGCGKSTLVNLVPRFYDPTAGAVRLNGVDLRDMSLADLRSRIALVSQQTLLFNDTIAANIRYGMLDASDEQVEDAARRADAHEFITTVCKDGYQTQVGQRGEKLSGGQRQKIALARAILRNADILILDEATSQVDIESEHQLHQVLKEFIADRTALMITHRLSTLSLANRILVLDAGRILDLGTHEQLLGRCEAYQRLHNVELRRSA